jgi:hypothetical protein
MANDPTEHCIKRMREDPYLRQSLAKTGFGQNTPPSIEMLSDKSRPNDAEKEALRIYSATRSQCIALGVAYRRANIPSNVALAFDRGSDRGTVLISKLYAGDITYGEFNTGRMEIQSQIRLDVAESDRQNAQAAAMDDDRRRAAAGMALQNMQNQQLILQQQQQQQQLMLQQNRPRNTNCYRMGSQMNCTTY